MTKLPEPAMRLHGKKNGTLTTESLDYYTEAQMLQFRRDALEEAIQCYSPDDTAADWTDKIRKLKDET